MENRAQQTATLMDKRHGQRQKDLWRRKFVLLSYSETAKIYLPGIGLILAIYTYIFRKDLI